MTIDEPDRPNPEELLHAITKQEKQQRRGKLKIFIGMAAGVGKTYAMLEEAHQLVQDGVDCAIGVIQTHGRVETAELLQGLKIIPEQIVRYRDKIFRELDVERIIQLNPEVVLVDELAHTNVPGLKHEKRWQDVIEILEHGISVYTTLNVQHIESLNDVVEGITEISVRETVPDTLIEAATDIQLVDITTQELLQRLKEGKVYLGEQSKLAAQNFFQKDRLTALREIVMRYAAEKVDRDLSDMATTDERIHWWKPREKLLVAISHSPHSQKLLRSTRRMAYALQAPWFAVHVNDGRVLSDADNNQLEKNITLARNLGAELLTTNDPNIANGLKRVARQKDITQIILGRPPATLFSFFTRFKLLETLATECPDIDIHVIRQERISDRFRKQYPWLSFKFPIPQYLAVTLSVFVVAILNWIALPHIEGYRLTGLIFLICILTLSFFVKKGPILFASVLYAFIWEYFFIPGGVASDTHEDEVLIFLYFVTAATTGILVDRAREHKEILEKSEDTTQSYANIIRQLAEATSLSDLLSSIQESLNSQFPSGSFEIIPKKINNGLSIDSRLLLIDDEKEKNAAIWVFESGQEAGWSTDTLPSAKNLYIPIKEGFEVYGVIIYHPTVNRILALDQKNFIYAVGNQLASYIKRTFDQEQQRQLEKQVEQQQLYEAALKLISKELESPLEKIHEAVFDAIKELHTEHKATALHKEMDAAVEKEVHIIEDSTEALERALKNLREKNS